MMEVRSCFYRAVPYTDTIRSHDGVVRQHEFERFRRRHLAVRSPHSVSGSVPFRKLRVSALPDFCRSTKVG